MSRGFRSIFACLGQDCLVPGQFVLIGTVPRLADWLSLGGNTNFVDGRD
jgi:hypothetical protein